MIIAIEEKRKQRTESGRKAVFPIRYLVKLLETEGYSVSVTSTNTMDITVHGSTLSVEWSKITDTFDITGEIAFLNVSISKANKIIRTWAKMKEVK